MHESKQDYLRNSTDEPCWKFTADFQISDTQNAFSSSTLQEDNIKGW